jgi:hypothetical protein
MDSLHGTAKEQILELYTLALRATWWGAMSFALLGLVLVAFQRPGRALSSPVPPEGDEESNKAGSEKNVPES